MICRDGVEMGWSTLGDFCINEGKFLGRSYFRNSVGIWVSDISQLEPYSAGSDKNEGMEKRFGVLDDLSSERMGSGSRGSSSPDYEKKEIKNIYIDCGNSTVVQNPVSRSTLKVALPLESGDNFNIMHSVALGDSGTGKESSHSGREPVSFLRTRPGVLFRPARVRKMAPMFDETKQSVDVQSGTQKKSGLDVEEEHTQNAFLSEERSSKSFNAEVSTIKSIMGKFEKALSPEPPTDEANRMLLRPPRVQRSSISKSNESRRAISVDSGTSDDNKSGLECTRDIDFLAGQNLCKEDVNNKNISSKTERFLSPEIPDYEQKNSEYSSGSRELNPVKIIKGVKVVSGRTRSLVEKFERGEEITNTEAATTTITQNTNETQEDPHITLRQEGSATSGETPALSTRRARSTPARVMPVVLNRDSNVTSDEPPVISTQPARTSSVPVMPVILNRAFHTTNDEPFATSMQKSRTSPARVLPVILNQETNMPSHDASVASRRPCRTSSGRVRPVTLSQVMDVPSHDCPVTSTRPARTSPALAVPSKLNQTDNMTFDASNIPSRHQMLATPITTDQVADMTLDERHVAHIQPVCNILTQKEEPQIPRRENDIDMAEKLMQNHDEFLNTLQSRLTKLQIVRHFWERNDVKGAIGALRKLTDQSVQADVISILTDKIEILTLDMFSQLVPVLTSLLGSRTERPVNVSLEMLLKLVAVFGTVIRSTVSAPRVVGVDLHADERLQICQICSAGFHKIQRILPVLARRGGLITRKAQELNLVLQ